MPSDPNSLIMLIVVGLIAGWLAGLIVQGSGFGVVGNIIIGIIGAFIGYFVFRFLHIPVPWGMGGQVLVAAIGSVVLLFILGLVRS